jgi:hypothetical protein
MERFVTCFLVFESQIERAGGRLRASTRAPGVGHPTLIPHQCEEVLEFALDTMTELEGIELSTQLSQSALDPAPECRVYAEAG